MSGERNEVPTLVQTQSSEIHILVHIYPDYLVAERFLQRARGGKPGPRVIEVPELNHRVVAPYTSQRLAQWAEIGARSG